MRCVVALLLLFLLPLGPVRAQSPVGPPHGQDEKLLFTAHRYGVEDGLPHRKVNSIAQDDRGFIWVATSQGLARFDGYSFRVYTMANGLSGNDIGGVYVDREGMLWVHSAGGFDIMDPRTERVETFQEHFAGLLPPEVVGPFRSVKASRDGDIVFTAKGYLFRFRGQQKPFEVIKVDCDRLSVVRADDNEAWCHCNPGGEYWGTVELIRIPFALPHKGGAAQKYPLMTGLGMCPQLQDLSNWKPSQDPGTYFGTKGGMVWTPTGGDPFQDDKRVTTRGGDYFCYIMPLTDDAWLVNTTVRRMHPGDNPFTAPVEFDLATRYPDASYGVQSAFRDRTGNVWLGGRSGLFKINMERSHFQSVLQDTIGGQGVGYQVRGMVVTGDRLHVNTEQQGYWVLDAATGAVISVDHTMKLRQMMVGDAHGGLWRIAGVDVLHEDASGKVDRTVSAPKGTYPPWSVLELKDGGLLVGTSTGMRIAGALADTSRVCPTGHPKLDHAWIWYLMYDRNDNVLACTNVGLFRLDEQGQVVERWWSGAMQEKDTAHYLPTDDIRNCYVDTEGIYWLATASNGLLRWDRGTGEVRSLGKREGIPAASIHAVLPDADGMLWMPTDNGLVRYDPVSGEVKTFTTNDGLPSNEFNRLAFTQGSDGRFYFGGMNGIAAFNPADLRAPSTKPSAPLVISRVYKQLAENQGQEDLTAAVLGGGPIVMAPSDRFFTVDMALLSYEDPAQIRYAWRIEGVDEVWNEQQEPHLRINTLPYGHHVLQIKAMDAKGRWTEGVLSMPIIMVPPFYLRWWFMLGVVLLVAFGVYQVVRYRERQLRKVMTMRDHLASDLHDEVGSTLSSIVLFSSAVGKQTDGLSKDAMGMLKRIKDNSTSAMENMNDIVWSVNSDHDSMENLFHRMRTYAQPLCDIAEIELEFHLDQSMTTRKVGMEQRKNLYLVFKEAVNNAVKHARCTHIVVHFGHVRGSLELKVLDNGTGISLSDMDKDSLGGNGLGNMNRRATEIGGTLEVSVRTEGGTQVRLLSALDAR